MLRNLVWLIPLLPFAGFAVNAFFGSRLPKTVVNAIALGSVFVSAVISWIAFAYVHHHAHDPGFQGLISAGLPWISIPGTRDGSWMKVFVEHRLVVDQLSAVMILVVTNVGFLIHLYSTGYMAGEKRYARYFAYLNLFTGFMLLLVMASNMLLMFVGWEGVGLCSYLLIGFWFEKLENAAAGMKAFVVNRIGDFGFTIGMLWLFFYLGNSFGVWTVDFRQIGQTLSTNMGALSGGVLTGIGILLFVGATGKSAQLPLFVWLPDAMAGPTPVSALIHAATMVTAGVYMVARMNFVFGSSPTAMTVVAVVGGLTALFAGTIGVAQNDIKKVLAYSTVSQLGFMFMGVGVGAFAAGIFHLMTHAFFKACLFLGSGSVIHGMGGEQDIRKMGGLKKYMPVTFLTFAVASLAIAGFPLLAGFWSKDEILWKAFSTKALSFSGVPIWCLGIVAAGFTAFYMTRLVVLTFLGEPRFAKAEEHHDAHDAGHGHGHDHGTPHESPRSMTIPLIVLAILSIVGGFIGMPHWIPGGGAFEHWLEPVCPDVTAGIPGTSLHRPGRIRIEGSISIVEDAPPAEAPEPHGPATDELVLMLTSVAIGLGGILLGVKVYLWDKGRAAEAFAARARGLYELVRDKYRVDELYQAGVVEPLLSLNEVLGRVDNVIIDGAVNGSAAVTASVSKGTGYFDNEVVDGAVNGSAAVAQAAARSARHLQTGHIRQYLTTALVGGLMVIAIYALWMNRYDLQMFLSFH
ncbi:MAG TPA: NADH-quinone oxidoreductase subunit L [Planctomycetota bacterium]|nr:NADH-quinone oxidoreductase subunit L [Planctomycetota bacterium]